MESRQIAPVIEPVWYIQITSRDRSYSQEVRLQTIHSIDEVLLPQVSDESRKHLFQIMKTWLHYAIEPQLLTRIYWGNGNAGAADGEGSGSTGA